LNSEITTDAWRRGKKGKIVKNGQQGKGGGRSPKGERTESAAVISLHLKKKNDMGGGKKGREAGARALTKTEVGVRKSVRGKADPEKAAFRRKEAKSCHLGEGSEQQDVVGGRKESQLMERAAGKKVRVRMV